MLSPCGDRAATQGCPYDQRKTNHGAAECQCEQDRHAAERAGRGPAQRRPGGADLH